jgi:hypothetical protein
MHPDLKMFLSYRETLISENSLLFSDEVKKWLEESESLIKEWGGHPDGCDTVKESMDEAPQCVERGSEEWHTLYEYLNDWLFFWHP